MSKKSEKLEQKLAALRDQIAAAQRAEREADKAELLRLIDHADCLPEALHGRGPRQGGVQANSESNRRQSDECNDE